MRFQADQIVIHKGETVEWTNLNPVEPHTVTFGNLSFVQGTSPFPTNPLPVDAEGVPHVSIKFPTDQFSSGIIVAGAQDPNGGPNAFQTPLTVTRFRATFPNLGTFPYRCVIHDDLGMKGTVIVLPVPTQ